MEKNKFRRKATEDMEASYIPAQSRGFKLRERKRPTKNEEQREEEPEPISGEELNDDQGLQ